MTRAEIEAAVYELAGYGTSAPDSRVVARIRRFLVEGVRTVLAEPGLSRLQDSDTPHTFASSLNEPRYTLPSAVARVKHISDRTNDRHLWPMSLAEYRALDPDAVSTTGTPSHYVPLGRVGVAVQPSDASDIFVDSTSASDVHSATLDGLITGGTLRSASVTMTGVTAVSLGITDFLELHDFTLSHPAVGTVTLHEDASGGTELARIPVGQTRASYTGLYLWPTPSAVVTYYVDYRRTLHPLATNTTEPPWPVDHHDLLVAYAEWREAMFKGNVDAASEAKTRYTQGLSRLKYATQTDSDAVLVMGRRRLIGRSRLGGYFPADTWTRW